jgi:hypothetical protein
MVSRSAASSSSLTETACNTRFRFGSMLSDANDQQDAGHVDDAFGGTSRNTCRAKSDRARGSLVPLPGQDGTDGQALEEALDAIAGWVCGVLT